MSKIDTMVMPNVRGDLEIIRGTRIRLQVGSVWIMFFIHGDTLSHWASGYKVGSLNGIKVSHMATMGHNAILSDRQAAKHLIARLVAQHGVAGLIAKFDAVPRLNTETKKGNGG